MNDGTTYDWDCVTAFGRADVLTGLHNNFVVLRDAISELEDHRAVDYAPRKARSLLLTVLLWPPR